MKIACKHNALVEGFFVIVGGFQLVHPGNISGSIALVIGTVGNTVQFTAFKILECLLDGCDGGIHIFFGIDRGAAIINGDV